MRVTREAQRTPTALSEVFISAVPVERLPTLIDSSEAGAL